MSYRITYPISNFINQVMMIDGINSPVNHACRNGEKITFMSHSSMAICNHLTHSIFELIKNGVSPNEIFILSASLKGKRIKNIENRLVNRGIHCFMPNNMETTKLDERVLKNKICFSTFSAAKGREKDHVFVLGFEQRYFDMFKNESCDKCPNSLYVATTRAKKTLHIYECIEHTGDKPLSFLTMGHYDLKELPYLTFKGIPRSIFYDRIYNKNSCPLISKSEYECPTQMLRFMSEPTLETIIDIIESTEIKKNHITFTNHEFYIDIPSIIPTGNDTYEDISDINGVAIPLLWYNDASVLDYLIGQNNDYSEMNKQSEKYIEKLHCPIAKVLLKVNVYIALKDQLHSKLIQLMNHSKYDWITYENLMKCNQVLNQYVGHKNVTGMETIIIHYEDQDQHDHISATLYPHFPDRNIRFK